MKKKCFYIICIALFSIEILFCIVRPFGMGQAYTALADDYSCPLWNPSCLDSQLSVAQIGCCYTKHFEDMNQYFLSVVFPTLKYGGFGFYVDMFDYGRFDRRDKSGIIIGSFTRNDITTAFAYGKRLWRNFHIGGTIKHKSITLSDITTANGVSFDIGVSVMLHKQFSVGILSKNIGDFIVKDENSIKQIIAYNSSRIGITFRPIYDKITNIFFLISADTEINRNKFFDRTFLGLEFSILGISLRAGSQIYKDILLFSTGLGYTHIPTGLKFDYAFGYHTDLGQNHLAGISWMFGSDIEEDRYAEFEEAKIKLISKKLEKARKETLKQAKQKILSAAEGEVKPRVAILDFRASEGVSPMEAAAICEELETALFASGVYNLIERRDIERVFREQGFQMSGVCEEDKKCIAEVGNILRVRLLVFGNVKRIGDKLVATAKMVDAKTAEVYIITESIEYEFRLQSIKAAAKKIADTLSEPLK
ncbi:MAG: hypothetical protein NZ839_02330 [Endomicrobia bacterium]|nr:hypothetical protein [Endomicrobiia bacterium]